jgi:SAM-dependent methyltransferase
MPVPIGGSEQHYGVDADEYFEHHESSAKVEAAEAIMQRAAGITGCIGKVLDIGAGRGETLKAAIGLGWDAVGIETSLAFAEHAAASTGAEIRREPLEKCAFAEASFDVVILAAVLEHLYNPDETIREIARLLRPGGALFLDVPNEEGLYFRLGNLYERLRGLGRSVNLAPTFSPFHVFGFSPHSLRLLLSKHGFVPRFWRVYAGTSYVPQTGGLLRRIESIAAKTVTAISTLGENGTYIETWAVKK